MIKSALQSSLTNDVKHRSMSAGAVPSNEYLIETVVVGATPASSIVFNNLGQHAGTYRHLVVVGAALCSASAADLMFQINSGVTYKVHLFYGAGGSVTSNGGISTSYGHGYVSYMVGGGTGSVTPTVFNMEILDAFSGSKNKTSRSFSGTSDFVMLNSSVALTTSSISSLTLIPQTSTFLTGSRFSIYGVN